MLSLSPLANWGCDVTSFRKPRSSKLGSCLSEMPAQPPVLIPTVALPTLRPPTEDRLLELCFSKRALLAMSAAP